MLAQIPRSKSSAAWSRWSRVSPRVSRSVVTSAQADMAIERQRFILGENVNPAQVGVDAVRQGDVDDAVNAAEGNGRFGPVASQGIEPLARAASQEDSGGVFHLAPQ